MLISRLTKLNSLLVQRSTRLLATRAEQQTDNAGPIVYQKLKGADKGIVLYGLNSNKDRNSLSFSMIEAMREVNQIIREDRKISVVILHSMIPKTFCAGKLLIPLFFHPIKLSFISFMIITEILILRSDAHTRSIAFM